jgi:hypothetical protein
MAPVSGLLEPRRALRTHHALHTTNQTASLQQYCSSYTQYGITTASKRRAGAGDAIITRAFFSSQGGDNMEPPGAPQTPRERLIPYILSIPQRLDRYFAARPRRRKSVWCAISAGAGFYAGNIVTLSFGALAINDVFAAIVTLIFYEIVSRLFYGAQQPSLLLWFANYFKIGVVLSMLADAVKLGG